MKTIVIGGGVSGLTCALRLQEAGHEVTVRARAWHPDIVSSVAAAIWQPYSVSHPRADQWALQSLARFMQLADEAPESGVWVADGYEFQRERDEPPFWATALGTPRALRPDELLPGYRHGYAYQLPVIETPLYMTWLRTRAEGAGVRFETGTVERLEALEGWPLIVNCTGLGARELTGDRELFPIRGQIVRLPAHYATHFAFDESDDEAPIYLIPRRDGLIVGGTALRGDEEMAARDETTATILQRGAQLRPDIAGAEILAVLVGLRPGRSSVRLEAEPQGTALVIHNYGHGGAGYTLSWGCAEEVVALAAGHG